jgi:hypothetical protein
VFDANGDEVPLEGVVAAIKEDRDAAIRERDALIARADYLERDRKFWCLQSGTHEQAANVLCARVAELEAAAKLAPAANADAVSKLRPISGAGKSAGEETQAASGAAGTEPDAWGVRRKGGVDAVIHRLFRSSAEASAEQYGGIVVPLYAAPQPAKGWLTAEERLAVSGAILILDQHGPTNIGHSLNALLARSTPPEVVLPRECDGLRYDSFVAGWNGYRDEALKALAAAGVTVKEVAK